MLGRHPLCGGWGHDGQKLRLTGETGSKTSCFDKQVLTVRISTEHRGEEVQHEKTEFRPWTEGSGAVGRRAGKAMERNGGINRGQARQH